MAERVIMPKAGMAMEEGTILKWLKAEGDRVEKGQPLVEIETDKVTMEIEAELSGTLLKITRADGETVPVIETIGWIGRPGEEIDQTDTQDAPTATVSPAPVEISAPGDLPATVSASSTGKIPATPAAKRLAREKGLSLADVSATGTHGEVTAGDVEAAASVRATPLARKMAQSQNVPLGKVAGSGPGGKIRAADLAPGPAAADTVVPLAGIRKTIARRMEQSHREVPPATLTARVDVTELCAMRKKLNRIETHKITLTDLILRAAARVLREQPLINTYIIDDRIVFKGQINIGIAVALNDGLVVPVIRRADTLSLGELSEAVKTLADKARAGKLLPDDLAEGTFTVSNLGMYGITMFTPIVNPPQTAILGICAVEDRLQMREGRVETHQTMNLCLTHDHRVIDGAQGALFLGRMKELLENPLSLLYTG